MEHVLKAIAQHWHLSAAHYWQLRVLCAVLLAPLLAVLYVVLFDRRRAPVAGVPRVVRRRITVLAARLGSHKPGRPAVSRA